MTHELKIMPEYFSAVQSGRKTFEVRKNDRNYQVGDHLLLEEWDNENHVFTGRAHLVSVTYILPGGQFGIQDNYVVMAIQ